MLKITNEVIDHVSILRFNRCSFPTSWSDSNLNDDINMQDQIQEQFSKDCEDDQFVAADWSCQQHLAVLTLSASQ